LRLVVLLCGVVAGIVGLGFGWWGESAALVDIYRWPPPQFVAAVLAIHLASANSIAGGLLVLVNPRVGGMMMLASASGWLLIVALLGGGLGLSMAALIGVGAGGGLLAFLPSLSRPVLRLDQVDSERPQSISAPQPARTMEAEEVPVQEEPATYNWRSTVYDASEDHSRPFTPNQWRFEAPEQAPGEEAADRGEPPPPPPRMPDLEPWVGADDRSDRVAYQIHGGQIRPLTLKAARRRRSRGRSLAGLAALTVLVVGVPTLLVVDHRMQLLAAMDEPTTGTAEAAQPLLDAQAGQSDLSAESRLEVRALPAFDESTVEPAEATAPALAIPAAYPTPFDYCADQPDIDDPDRSMIAEGLPLPLIEGVREVTNIADAEVLWRCMGEVVWVCAQPPEGVACDKVPTTAERRAYCAQNPGASDIVAAAGTWHCEGTTPVVPGGDQRTTDPRGYDRLAWLGLSKAPKTAG
jgi:hypothetical protein